LKQTFLMLMQQLKFLMLSLMVRFVIEVSRFVIFLTKNTVLIGESF
jgi:hypothetical protein